MGLLDVLLFLRVFLLYGAAVYFSLGIKQPINSILVVLRGTVDVQGDRLIATQHLRETSAWRLRERRGGRKLVKTGCDERKSAPIGFSINEPCVQNKKTCFGKGVWIAGGRSIIRTQFVPC